jgi:competence protein ComEA
VSDPAPVDINAATAAELDAVPALKGHGHEIVRYRDERGGFTDLRQLDEVPGMVGRADGLDGVLTVDERGTR